MNGQRSIGRRWWHGTGHSPGHVRRNAEGDFDVERVGGGIGARRHTTIFVGRCARDICSVLRASAISGWKPSSTFVGFPQRFAHEGVFTAYRRGFERVDSRTAISRIGNRCDRLWPAQRPIGFVVGVRLDAAVLVLEWLQLALFLNTRSSLSWYIVYTRENKAA